MQHSLPSSLLNIIAIFSLLLTLSPQGLSQTLVVTDEVKKMDFHDHITLISRTQAIRSSKIVAAISGQVAKINAAEGSRVSKGTALVTIRQERLRLVLAAKIAEANQAKALSAVATKTFKRSKGLYTQDLISESIIDSDSALALAGLERYHQLLAEQERLAFDLANCTIKAPFSGYTGRQLVDVGEWVNPGTPVFELVDPSVIKVTVDLPEKYFGQLSLGSSVVVSISSDTEKSRVGRVTGISQSAQESTHTFPIFVAVDNRDGFLGGGMLVKTTISLNKKFTSLAVSKDAIVRDGLQTMVYTITEGKAVRIPVMTSSTNGELIAVEGDGRKKGMQAIIRGNERIFPGSAVRLANDTSDSQHSN